MKYTVPKGTRDFLPAQMLQRNYIFQTISTVYQLHGFVPIETPAMENLSTLMGKYGEEGDRLLFKILNSGNFLEKASHFDDPKKLTTEICERGLRYDLTVPFARFVVQHQNELTFPFKRYQIQPVWRGDRPQKGRYREFYQCDGDVIGSNSLLNELEFLQIINEVFEKLGIRVVVKLNNRKILAAIAALIGQEDKLIDITVAIDKMDKIGIDQVKEELLGKGLKEEVIQKLTPVLLLDGSNAEKLLKLQDLFVEIPIGQKGVEEMQTLLAFANDLAFSSTIDFDITLARGLNYYTGTIFEVKSADTSIGSLCGGGRYDDLTGIFGLPNLSGVGISFGADRIYDTLEELNLFPQNLQQSSKILFCNFGEKEEKQCILWAEKLRKEGIKTEIYPENAKLKKQIGYADAKRIPFVALVGEQELAEQKVSLKNLATGEQISLKIEELVNFLKN